MSAWGTALRMGLGVLSLGIPLLAGGGVASSPWQELGPMNTSWFEGSMGRVNCVAAHPADPNRLYAGGASGGLWTSPDGGVNWQPLSDFLPVLGVSSVVVDYSNPNVLYLATGDADNADTLSVGVMKSTDGGVTWNTTGLSYALSDYKFVVKLVQHPTQPATLLAATTDGIQRTINGGTTWTRTVPGGTNTVWWDVAYRPGDPSVVYAVADQGRFYRSTDGGVNWTPVTTGLPSASLVTRAKLAVSTANPSGVYLVCVDTANARNVQGLYRSLDGGATFALRPSYVPYFIRQGYYNLAITVSPTDFNEVYVGGVSLSKSTDGGTTWIDASQFGVTHVDYHALTYLHGALYSGTDGGVHRTINGAGSWTDLSSRLGLQQIYAMSGAPGNAGLIYIGTRDNGLNNYSNGAWQHGAYGDWLEVIADPAEPTVHYAVRSRYLHKIGGYFYELAPTGNPDDPIASLAIHPSAPRTVYASSGEIYKSLNGGTNWQVISAFPDSDVGWFSLGIVLAPSNPNYIHTIRGGRVWRTTDAGVNWTLRTNGLPVWEEYDWWILDYVPEGGGVQLAVSSSDPNKLWLAQNDDSTANKVYYSANGGASWTPYSGSLPNRKIQCIVYEPGSNDGVYVGFDAGVYYRNASMSDWQAYDNGLPNSPVSELEVHDSARKLRAATFGRGLWQVDLAGSGPAQFTVTTSSSPANGGTTTGGGTYNSGQSVTVTATANAGFAFANWTENGSVVSSSASYTFSATANRTLVANFTALPVTYVITTISSPANGGTTTGGGTYNSGQSVTVTATVNAGFAFANWTQNGSVVSSSASYTFSATANRTLVANFTALPVTYVITTSSSPANGGTTSGGGTYNSGQSVTVTATANAGFAFANWTQNGSVVSSSASYTFSATANRTLVANFTALPVTYVITTSSSPANGGTTTGGGTYNSGQSVTVTATANAGFAFANWTEGASVVSSLASYTFSVTANRTLAANFTNTPIDCTITVANVNDSGPGSLRQAIADVCPGGTITFAPALNGQTIVLTSGQLVLSTNITILGLGATNLSISGNASSRVFLNNPGATSLIARLSIMNGNGVGTSPGGTPSGNGGGILNQGSLTISNCVLSGGSVIYNGGGIFSLGTLSVQESTLTSNSALSSGGGINNFGGTLAVQNTTLSGSTADFGGGIYNGGTLMVQNSTLSGNVSTLSGGGIQNGSGSGATILDSTLSGNLASVVGGGINNNGTLTLQNSTLTGNRATSSGGGLYANGFDDLAHCIVAGNFNGSSGTTPGDIGGTVSTAAYNLIGDAGSAGSIANGMNGNLVGNAGVGARPIASILNTNLVDNGGPTRTHALLPGSPAIDAGTNGAIAGLPYDQRGAGFPRLFGSAVDIGAYELQASPFFDQIHIAGLPGVDNSSITWGDYDNDGRLDFLLTGTTNTQPSGAISQVWRNTGNGFSNMTSQVASNLPGVMESSVAWGDYDNDGRLDFLLTGRNSLSALIAQLWRNTGSGFSNVTSQVATGLPGIRIGSAAWGDYDNDGRLDFLLMGQTQTSYNGVSQLWRNTGSGFSNVTSQAAAGLPGATSGSVAWGDYDNDGRLDFLLTGYTGSTSISQLWRNTGSGFSNVTSQVAPGLPGVSLYSKVAWGDYDNDGRLDFLLAGTTNGNFDGGVSQLWRNTGTGFSNVTSQVAAGLPGVSVGSLAWGDYDNDGRLDFLLTGQGSTYISQLWRNTGSGFSNVTSQVATGLPGVLLGSVAWGDYDNDGRLDFLLTGYTGSTSISQLRRNSFSAPNSPPSAPTGLTDQTHGVNSVTLSWSPASDAQTPALGLTYNLVLGSSSSAVDLASPHAEVATGFRRVVRLGAVNAGLGGTRSYTFTNLPPAAQYFWSVQALDTAFAGGPFAPAQSFLLDVTQITVLNTNDSGPGSLRQALADVSSDGTITFAPALNDQTIVLTSGELVIGKNLTILGPGADMLAISGNQQSRVISVSAGTTVHLSGLTVTRGQVSSSTRGAGIRNSGDLTLTQCTVSSNQVVYNGINDPNAGGIMNEVSGSLTLVDCAVQGNSAYYGAGIYNNGEMSVTQSTISGNAAAIFGGGILSHGSGSLRFVTVANNLRNGLHVSSGPVTFEHCVFAANSIGNFTAGGNRTSLGHNLSSDATGNLTAVGDLSNTDPLLGPLADNGGPTPTHALLPGSPAIDAGTNGVIVGLLNDQRGPGYQRLFGSAVDIGAYELQAPSSFTQISIAGLPGLFGASVAWGDYDSDGRLDFLIAGRTNRFISGEFLTQLWRNTGSGFVQVSVPGLPGLDGSTMAWGDYNNDGQLDFVIAGTTNYDFSGRVAQLWQNTGGGFVQVPIAGLPGVVYGSAAWGDYDNDGRLDFLITGETNFSGQGQFVSQLWRNTSAGFTQVPIPGLQGVGVGSVAWIDYDKDGLLDFSITGTTIGRANTGGLSQLWRNTGHGFANVPIAGLLGVVSGSMAWCDYDNDGRLDFLLTGTAQPTFNYADIAQLWRNTGSGFTLIPTPGLPGIAGGSAAWGDYDNDGRPDLLLSGYNGSVIGETPVAITGIWRNTGSGFVEEPGSGPAGVYASVAWGDYNNDGRLHYLLSGVLADFEGGTSSPQSRLWRNNSPVGNSPPNAPAGLTAQVHPNSLTLSWLSASDDHTPPSGLSYNLVLATSPNGVNLASPLANLANGYRRVVRLGGANQRTSWTFTNLPPSATYYWSVQAVDSAFAGGMFAPVQGVLNVVFTSMAKPGSDQATLAFIGTTGQLYTIERSDDLAAWTTAGTATESPAGSGNFIFLDPTATGSKRFYRIRD